MIAILGLPVTTSYEHYRTQSEPDYRFGSLHLALPAIACLILLFLNLRWSWKIGLFILTPFIIFVLEITAVLIDIIFFTGFDGVHI